MDDVGATTLREGLAGPMAYASTLWGWNLFSFWVMMLSFLLMESTNQCNAAA